MSHHPSQPMIEVEALCRNFGEFKAVDRLSFKVEAGQVVGFIGANGAGKTTTMRMMATLDLPTAGNIRINGFDTVNFPNHVRSLIGWMPDAYGTYTNMSVGEYLDFFARAFGYTKGERRQRVEEVAEFTNLTDLMTRPMNKLSKGMAQRLCLGRTLLHDPALLILDEPAAGLDPKARIEFKHLVRLLAEEGKTLFISSHILSELGEMCDSLLFIDKGQLVHHGSSESLRVDTKQVSRLVEVTVIGAPERLLQWVELNPGVRLEEATRAGARLCVEDGTPEGIAAILRAMVRDEIAVVDYRRHERKLEDAFVEILNQQPPTLP